MKKYTAYFEISGKKMKTTIIAACKEKAKAIIKENIIFHKVVDHPDDDIVNTFMNMFGMK
jgi:hypothetical protein